MTRNRLFGALYALTLFGMLLPAARAQTFPTPYNWISTLAGSSPTFHQDAVFGGSSGLNWYFSALTFIPSTTGGYTLSATYASLATGIPTDTYFFLYNGIFDPNSPAAGLIIANDNDVIQNDSDSGGVNSLSSITRNLTGGSTYTLVSSTYAPSTIGTINNRITGPSGSSISLASAPEPGSLALLGLVALPAFAVIRRKRLG